MVTKELGRVGKNSEVGINIYILLYIKKDNQQRPGIRQGEYIQHFVITYKRF